MNKVRDLVDVVREIPDGAEIGLGGFIISRCPMAFAAEMIRQGKKDLVIHSLMGTLEADLLIGAGCVKSYSYSGGSMGRFGKLGRVNEAIERGTTEVKELSGLSMALRFQAGCLGIPFIPTKALIGTDMLETLLAKEDDCVKMGKDPWTGETYLYLKALRPDYCVIHANAVDEKGNVIIHGPTWDVETAKAAKKLVVTAERLVSNEYVKAHPEEVKIPGAFTYAACIVPAGGYPSCIFGEYDYDAEALWKYGKLNLNQEEFDEMLKEYVYGTKDHYDFLDKIGGVKKLSSLCVDSTRSYTKEGA